MKGANADLDKFYRPHKMQMQSYRVHFDHLYFQAHVLGGTTWSDNYKAQ